MSILDKYYKYSILFDIIMCSIICFLICLFELKFGTLPYYDNYDKSICSDLGSIGLTTSGFLLTISTILISFKTSSIESNDKLNNKSSSFKIFISSPLYFETVNYLNKAVLILVGLSILNFLLKILVLGDYNKLLFLVNISSIIIISTTFMRCLYLLRLIIKMQK